MPVPASYNDIGEDASLRDHVGLVWYDRRFHVPPWWGTAQQRVWLRFSSVHYAAQVVSALIFLNYFVHLSRPVMLFLQKYFCNSKLRLQFKPCL